MNEEDEIQEGGSRNPYQIWDIEEPEEGEWDPFEGYYND